MKIQRLPWYLLGLVPLFLVGLLLLGAMKTPVTHLASLGRGVSLSASAAQAVDQPFDTRPCQQHPSPQNCNGVLPFGFHYSVLSRDNGSGSCYDDQAIGLEDQQITDTRGRSIGDFQLWFLASCKSYTAHLIFNAGSAPATISATVQQFDGGGIENGITKFFWHLGNQDSLLPSATQSFGPVQDSEIWSPLLYSPTAPVQATASIAVPGTSYAPITGYYASGQPTTINGKSA